MLKKKFKNHAIFARITHFLLLTGFGDFPRGSETVSAEFQRLFHGVHGHLDFPPSYGVAYKQYIALHTSICSDVENYIERK